MNEQQAIQEKEQLIEFFQREADHAEWMVRSTFGLVGEMWVKRAKIMRQEVAEKEAELKQMKEEVQP